MTASSHARPSLADFVPVHGRPNPVDAFFHAADHLRIGAIVHLAGKAPDLASLRSHIADHLDRLPVLRCVFAQDGWREQQPDLTHHVRETVTTCLNAAVGELTATPFDPGRSEWDLTLIHGYADDAYVLFYRVHHGVHDWAGIAHTLETLFGPVPRSSATIAPGGRRPTPRHYAVAARLLASTASRSTIWPLPPFTGSGQRVFHWENLPLNWLDHPDASRADVYAWGIARSVADWAAEHRLDFPRDAVEITIAANLRHPHEAAAVGSRMVPVRFRLPADDLRACAQQLLQVKHAGTKSALRNLNNAVPSLLGRRLTRQAARPAWGNLAVSSLYLRNPLAFTSHPVTRIEPLMVRADSYPLVTLAVTYQNQLSVCFVSDPALPGMDTLHQRWRNQITHLHHAH